MLEPYLIKGRIEAGCDEAGRGCLAGPVTAAAVILPEGFSNDLLNDSKQLTEKQRDSLRPIIEREALAWAVAFVTPQEIDELMEIMRGFAKEGKSILFITHKLNEIMAVADRCTVLRKGKYIGTVEIANCPIESEAEKPVF